MTTTDRNNLRPHVIEATGAPSVPAWVSALLAGAEVKRSAIDDLGLSIAQGRDATLVTIEYRNSVRAPADVLEAKTAAIFGLLRDTILASPHPYPLRLWSFLPNIHQQLDPARDRYMVFNGGRYKGYCRWWGGRENFPQRLPTASGVGHSGEYLIVFCLAGEQPGIAIDNPRQIPAFGYSKRYGPLPPCFSRATLMTDHATNRPALLIGGTASIRGEQSMHAGSLPAQTDETLTNIAALIRAASVRLNQAVADDAAALGRIESLRVYHPNPADRPWISTTLSRRFDGAVAIEYVQADLCRAELLIEIEGVARFTLGA